MCTFLIKPWRIFFALWVASSIGCIDSNRGLTDDEITCNNYQDFLGNCTANCDPTWDCEDNYLSLRGSDQVALDYCSDCLVQNLDNGFCSDCAVPSQGVASCHRFMNDLLGVACWF